jgi:hypothetical protein
MTLKYNFNDTTPVAPANSILCGFQKDSDSETIENISMYVRAALVGTLGVVKPDGVGIGIDTSGKIFLVGTSLYYKGPWGGSTLYNVGDISTYGGTAYLCIGQVDGSVTPSLVQASANGGSSVAFSSAVTEGNLLIVLVTANGSAVTPTDTLGTIYTLVDQNGGVGFFGNLTSMYFGVALASGTNTVSSGIGGASGIAVAEFSGTTTIVDTHSSNINVSSLSLTTTHAAMIVIGRAEHSGNTDTYTGTGGVTIGVQRSDAVGGTMAIGYVAEGSAGTYTPGISATGNHNQVMIAVAFRDGAISPDQDTEHWLAMGAAGVITTQGDLIVGGPSAIPQRLAAGSVAGQVLTSNGTAAIPSYQAVPATPLPTGSGRKFVATPSDGSSAVAALRTIFAADLPAMVGDSGSGGSAGIVPAPAAGDAAAGKFLKADGSFSVPVSSSTPIVIGFGVPDGSVANTTGPGRLTASRAGSINRCVVTVNASDGVTALTIRIKQNGTNVFTSSMTVAAGTAAGTVQISTALTSVPLAVAQHDVFTIDVTSGTSTWNFTAQLEG